MNPFGEAPRLRHLRMVQVIGRVGAVSAASRELCASQPAVTQAVANLEAELGNPIFQRSATGTYPTPLGKQFLLRIDRFFAILDHAIAQVLGRPTSDRGAPRVDRVITGTQLRSLIVTTEPERVDEIARGLGFEPHSLWRSARSIERALGKPLFDRTARGPMLNNSGEFLGREFRRAMRELELARGEFMLAAGFQSLELIVGMLPMAGAHELSAAIRRFLADHPAVTVRIVTGEYDKLLVDLVNSRIDMIFGMLRKPDWAGDIGEELLFRDRYCIVARHGHPLARLDEVSPADLARYPWVVPAVGTPRRGRIEAMFEGLPQRPRFGVETSSLSMSRALLLDSDTVTLMTRFEVQSELDLGVLAALRCRGLDDVLPKGVTSRGDWLPTRAHAAFLDCLREVTVRLGTDLAERRADAAQNVDPMPSFASGSVDLQTN